MVRRANITDVPGIAGLIKIYADRGEMLPRPQAQIYSNIRDFVVVEEGDELVGCGALHVVWSDIAEVRSLAVAPSHVGKGWGREMVELLLNDAHALGLPKVFTLTYKPGFFSKLGFRVIDKKELPHKVWADCLNCPHFPDCDEIAMLLQITN